MSQPKIVLITGASRGIGASTAKLFAQKGFFVYLNYKSNKQEAENVGNSIISAGGKCKLFAADVSKEAEVKRLFQSIDDEPATLSTLINNVGILEQQKQLVDISEERFLRIMITNVMSCFLCSKEAVKRMSTKHGGEGGNIVNVSSGAAKSGSPKEYIDYAASKGAIDTLTRGLALEVADEGIRVNSVRPGLIYTDIHAMGGEPDRVNRLSSKIPLKRGGQTHEVAEAIYWFASGKSSYATGSFLDLTGGL